MATDPNAARRPSRLPDRHRRRRGPGALAAAAVLATLVAIPHPVAAAGTKLSTIQRIDVATDGTELPKGVSGSISALSDDGRYVAFATESALQPDDTNGKVDTYLRDRVAGTVQRVSYGVDGKQIAGYSTPCGMSRNARYVAFYSAVTGGALGPQVYLRDIVAGTTVLVSQSSAGVYVPSGTLGEVDRCPVSDDGRYVAFSAAAGNLVSGDVNGVDDVFRRDVTGKVTILVSRATGAAGTIGNQASRLADISADGNTVLFDSTSTNLVANDTNAKRDAFVRIVSTNTTERVSTKANGGQITGDSLAGGLGANGSRVAFASGAADLLPADPNTTFDVFVKDRSAATVVLASVSSSEVQANGQSGNPSISTDGTHVAFTSAATNLAAGDDGNFEDAYVRHLGAGTTEVVSRGWSGAVANSTAFAPRISGDGTVTLFRSYASNLVQGDANAKEDVFVRDTALELDPFLSATAFVQQQYLDLAGRAPTAGELTQWTQGIGNGTLPPDQLVTLLANQSPWATKRAPMTRLYWAFFLRPPDTGGMQYWLGKLQSGTTLAAVAKQFSTSSEFQAKYGSKTNGQFVTLVYQNIFGRNPDPAGLAYWTKKLDTKQKTRGDVMVNFSESSEGKRVLSPQVQGVLVHLGLLRTMPSSATLLKYVAELRTPLGADEAISWRIRTTSSTYAGRVAKGP